MSTAARKLRKRSNLAATFTAAGTKRNPRALRSLQKVRNAERFAEHFKVGTPVAERAEFQPRSIFGKGHDNPPTRFGLTSRAARKLIFRGYTAERFADELGV